MVLGIYFTPVDLFLCMFNSLTPVSKHTICFETGVQERPFRIRMYMYIHIYGYSYSTSYDTLFYHTRHF